MKNNVTRTFPNISALNEYKEIKEKVGDTETTITLKYDDNGNTKDTGKHKLTFDAMNRITEVLNTKTGITAKYGYDALNRHVLKEIPGANTKHFYFYDDFQTIEECTDKAIINEFVYGNGIDEILAKFDSTNGIFRSV